MMPSCRNSSISDATDISPETYEHYLLIGRTVTEKAQKTLLHQVSEAMRIGGPVHAIDYCNLKAIGITDSLSEAMHASISRISNRYRNPLDKPDQPSENQILDYFEQVDKSAVFADTVMVSGDDLIYYKPIFIKMGTCLQCHGVPGVHVQESTLNKLQELYPEDKAINHNMDDLRGAWQIKFTNELKNR